MWVEIDQVFGKEESPINIGIGVSQIGVDR